MMTRSVVYPVAGQTHISRKGNKKVWLIFSEMVSIVKTLFIARYISASNDGDEY